MVNDMVKVKDKFKFKGMVKKRVWSKARTGLRTSAGQW